MNSDELAKVFES